MADHVVSINEKALQVLHSLAVETGEPVEVILEKALDQYRRKLFFEQYNAAYAALRADPVAWAEELAERRLLEGTLMDGLDPDERWTDDGNVLPPESPNKNEAHDRSHPWRGGG